MRFFSTRTFTPDRAWAATELGRVDDVSVRLHWTDAPYVWHVNDGPEVFLVVDGAVDMHYRDADGEHVRRLQAGDACSADFGDAHVARPAPVARVVVVERAGSI
jgi:mannose-6-phosphate isomerase-like protein (cupin superfamily)